MFDEIGSTPKYAYLDLPWQVRCTWPYCENIGKSIVLESYRSHPIAT